MISLPSFSMITVTSVEGNSFKYSPTDKKISKVDIETPFNENEVITTSSKGVSVIDFNSEVIGTVVLAENTQVILRKSNADGTRLLSLIRGHLRFYRDKKFDKKKVGVIINIRDNPTAYHGTNYEIQYSAQDKTVTSFNKTLRKFTLSKSHIDKKKKVRKKSDRVDQELSEDLKFLLESS